MYTSICLCAAIGSFIKFCGDLLTPELSRRLMLPLDSALAQISGYVVFFFVVIIPKDADYFKYVFLWHLCA